MPDEPLNLEDASIAEPPPATPAEQPPTAEPPKPAVDEEAVTGLREALISERRRRQELEERVSALTTPPKPTRDVPDVSDEDAERYARRYELYTPNGLDLGRAKQIIADNRAETAKIAKQAAEEAVAPVQEQTAKQGAREQFIRVAMSTDAGGQRLLDESGVKELAQKFANMPPQLAALPEVADLILNSVIGERTRGHRQQPKAPDKEPVFSEASGGPRLGAYTISNLEKKVAESRGIAASDWEKTAKTYQPGVPNVLE